MAALNIDPWRYLDTEDRIDVMAGQAIAEGANEFLNRRDVALARMIAQETVKLLSKSFKRK